MCHKKDVYLIYSHAIYTVICKISCKIKVKKLIIRINFLAIEFFNNRFNFIFSIIDSTLG